MTKNSRHTAVTWAIALAACCLLAVGPVDAQSKKSAKQAESLEEAGESSKVAVRGVLEHLSGMLSGYNSIINGDAKDTQAAYKKLVGDLKAADKKIEGAGKQLASLNKEAEKFFQGWEQDLAGISSEGLREKSASRLETAKARYASLGDTLSKASAEFAPVVRDLNDQILFLGRDLSPAAVADLKDEAEALNRKAEEATARVRELLLTAGKAQQEAEAEIDAN